MPFLPTTIDEAAARGWDELDIIFVTGDAYIDHPSFGVPLLARFLESSGFRVGIIAQPDWRTVDDFRRLGRPRLFFAVSAGAMDSMVAHYTPARKLRRDDAYTPGNRHGARPNRGVIVYTSRVKEAYPGVPVVIGGIEASLRRFAHYDYWDDRVRRSILLDSKADLLVYGMGEKPILEIAARMRRGEEIAAVRDVRGTCYATAAKGIGSPAASPPPPGLAAFPAENQPVPLLLPSFEEVSADRKKYAEAFRLAAWEQNHWSGRAVLQPHGERLLVCNPPSLPLTTREMDELYALPFEKEPHPSYREPIPAFEQIRSSVTTHRGCYGGCAFCAITAHQGKTIQSRSEESVCREIAALSQRKWFRGSISDVGGPTANMYGSSVTDPSRCASCRRESCLFPAPCRNLAPADAKAAALLRKVRGLPGVKHVAVSSGVRYDLLARQPQYLRELLGHHVGGLLKVAPEHLSERVTRLMRKPGGKAFGDLLRLFREESARLGKRQAIVPYFISSHPGCTLSDMADLALYLKRNRLKVEQVQDFTPTPGTLSTCVYYTGIDPFSGETVYVPRAEREKNLQKSLLLWHLEGERKRVLEALRGAGRERDAAELLGAPPAGKRPPHR
ncbi:MAG TPA: YgiQ family radical SAM protein [Verrucomicrobiae bacterium]|nr:YgiQ family radical SAM protein [Verrucomicrobiae bacterium]